MFWSRWFKDKNSTQEVCLITATNLAKDIKLDADLLHASLDDTAEGWLLDSHQMVKDEITNEYIQFVSSKYGCPIKIRKTNKETDKPDIGSISSQTEDQEMVFTTDQHSKSGMMLWVGIATSLLTLCVLITLLTMVV